MNVYDTDWLKLPSAGAVMLIDEGVMVMDESARDISLDDDRRESTSMLLR